MGNSSSPELTAMAQEKNIGTFDYGTLPIQQTDTTICSNDSNYAINNSRMPSNDPKTNGKIKAYVDFSEFNKNYEEYLRDQAAKNSTKEAAKESAKHADLDDRSIQSDLVILDRQSSKSSTQSEEWEILTDSA